MTEFEKDYQIIKKKIARLIRTWGDRLGTNWFKIHNIYTRDPRHMQTLRTVGQASVRWEYLEATIKWNMVELVKQEFSNEDLETLVLHELCHVLISEMAEAGEKHRERVCVMVERAIKWTWEAGITEGKK